MGSTINCWYRTLVEESIAGVFIIQDGLYPLDGNDGKTLLKNADTALYRAKEYGKNTHQVYSPTLNIQTFKSFSLEKDLRKAIHHGELELYYQPRVDAISGQILSGEALIRWNHPDWGMVSPDEFISLAEEYPQTGKNRISFL